MEELGGLQSISLHSQIQLKRLSMQYVCSYVSLYFDRISLMANNVDRLFMQFLPSVCSVKCSCLLFTF